MSVLSSQVASACSPDRSPGLHTSQATTYLVSFGKGQIATSGDISVANEPVYDDLNTAIIGYRHGEPSDSIGTVRTSVRADH